MYDHHGIIAEMVSQAAQCPAQGLAQTVTRPPSPEMGDFAFPCFPMARTFRKAPAAVAVELAGKLVLQPPFLSVEAAGPYLNFRVDPVLFVRDLFQGVNSGAPGYVAAPVQGDPVVVEFSSPNVAKPFSIGHLRSTVIGAALSRIHAYLGSPVIRINHLGDWGTQFGKLVVAYRRWGMDLDLSQDATPKLYELYVRFHEEVESDPTLEAEARETFASLEAGDEDIRALWELFVSRSVSDLKRIYGDLGVEFDHYTGESFYIDKLDQAFAEVDSKGLVQESQGALIVDLSEWSMPPCLLRKTDGATLYATRDLAAAIYRQDNYSPSRVIYVVGTEQSLHFRQLFKVLELLGRPVENIFEHVNFGLYRFGNEKMSTRRGKVIFMEDVLAKAVEMAGDLIQEKNPGLRDRESVARQVGIGAVIFGDLVNDRARDIDFDWERILSFEGDTGPYIQYSVARINSIFRKAAESCQAEMLPEQSSGEVSEGSDQPCTAQLKVSSHEVDLAREIMEFPEVVARAGRENKPHHIAKKALDIAKVFSRFYHNCPVLSSAGPEREFRLELSRAAQKVLVQCLALLGIQCPDEM
ncbi:MAG: arginine--tRNA ligase [Candidatus Wallbacteria bacterium HGW-Wallbacteria-1]|jgi:arginyl-tRNA synthetase|uniref:Arginine--tRNA ligase n=1 Tax=Candidatus Wallbacteria bacterium HGW-Wallbacteria-1 TaxID=2013854 RepID=A0A2N1PUP7_9BACT|nr:MAG: arginine--tRNA ligase [Candidatus Wallbacteria bacterium HGW-Wallbacteria-1]